MSEQVNSNLASVSPYILADLAGARATGQVPEASLKDVRRNLFRRILDCVMAGRTALAPQMMYLNIEAYLDADMHEVEQRKLFREMPQVACLSTDLPEPGSFRLFEETGVPMLVTRGNDGLVRAFLNICPHRGAKIVRDESGRAMRHSCRFHAWTFDTQGRAAGIPEEGMFCNQIDGRKQLVEFPVEERHGFVFVQATAGSTMDLNTHLGDFGRELELLNIKNAHRVCSMDVRSPSNWKYALDTYFENYHLPSLHRDFSPRYLRPACACSTHGGHITASPSRIAMSNNGRTDRNPSGLRMPCRSPISCSPTRSFRWDRSAKPVVV